MLFNNNMNKSNKKKLGKENANPNLVNSKRSKTVWKFEVEGSGQRKRYLRSLKENYVI